MTLILNRHEVAELLTMKDCIQVVEAAFLELKKGTAVQPLRTTIHTEKGLSLIMPAYLGEMKALACKVVTVFKANPTDFKMPVIMGKVFLQDPDTGKVICIMDGGCLTAIRTGAASGVATKYLANNKERMSLGIIGSGVQAKMQLAAIAEVRDIQKVLVYDISTTASKKFITASKKQFHIDFEIVKHPDKILEADIICTATSSSEPVFDGNKVKNGTHINAIGSHTPEARELDTAIVAKSKFVGDSKEACLTEAGDFIIPLQNNEISATHFYAELGEIISGNQTGRISPDEITIFKSNGLAIQDAAAAKWVYQKALDSGIGNNIEF